MKKSGMTREGQNESLCSEFAEGDVIPGGLPHGWEEEQSAQVNCTKSREVALETTPEVSETRTNLP
jgi:hypothetical protein